MYFIVQDAEKVILCPDGSWAGAEEIIDAKKEVLAFMDANNAHCTMYNLSQRAHVFVFSESVTRKKLKLGNTDIKWRMVATACSIKDQEIQTENRTHSAHEFSDCIGMGANNDKVYETPLIQDTLDILERLIAILDRWNTTEREYDKDLKAIMDELLDEQHFMEFETLNGVEGYQAYKRMHDILIRRRRIKNEYNAVTYAKEAFPSDMEKRVKHAIASIEGLKTQKYTPRTHWPERIVKQSEQNQE